MPTPLMYQWHESYYLGAAHGISGILYMLLQVANIGILLSDHLLFTPLFYWTKIKPYFDFCCYVRKKVVQGLEHNEVEQQSSTFCTGFLYGPWALL